MTAGLCNFAMALSPMTIVRGAAPWKLGILSAAMGMAMVAGAFFAERYADRFAFFSAALMALSSLAAGAMILNFTLNSLALSCAVLLCTFFFLPLFNSD
ncbi:hypothetical protein CCICO_02875 [Corynebacterium ciconiae DSM 44920]|nr:hypothetical protein CCICO_02875 [Corynebacterium ciconiae DSM 44920]